jgi:sugar-specific transcriptional regulator TrmB
LSKEKVLKTLEELGLSKLDARVYFFLAKKGSKKAKEVTLALKIAKQQLYPSLKSLQSKSLVNATLEHPARFSAVPFEKALDLFVKAKMEEAKSIQQSKDKILTDWQSIVIQETEDRSAKFTVIEGRKYVYSKIQQMIQDTKNHLSFVAPVPGLARADQFGLFDVAFNHPSKAKIQFRFLTELSAQNVNVMKALLKKKPKGYFKIMGKTPDLGLKLCPRMVIKDEEETVFFIDSRTGEFTSEEDEVGLWTNCKSLVHAFLAIFEDLWCNSTNIEIKIAEIESGKPAPKTYLISDAKTAYNKYHEIMRSAKKEVILTTSAKGLISCWKGIHLVKQWVKRGISIKIMAPIVSENLEAAQQLLKFCEVKHVPTGYLGTTVVDGKHLFQLKSPPPDQEKPEALAYFENTFYTNDAEYVEKTRNMLINIWKNAHTPSAITLEAITNMNVSKGKSISDKTIPRAIRKLNGFSLIENEKLLGHLTGKNLLNKIINARRNPVKNLLKDIVRLYGSGGQAVIHPPDCFNLPHLLFHILHLNKKSAFGAEDVIMIYTRLEKSSGYSYLPGTLITDNPEAIDFWRKTFAGAPFDFTVVKKHEFLVQIQHKTLFAGWTVPIPLSSRRHILPPSCILIEGYGNVKSSTFTVNNPSGYRVLNADNGFEAFVTFMHPSSKYTGPGTDGFFAIDYFSATYPPSSSSQL